MKTLRITSQFKKDLKRYKHQPSKIQHLNVILEFLENECPIPPQYKPHMLTGDYKGHMECHVENDLLLIWRDPLTREITLVRFGSHSEVF